jgi:hypothetical protein
MARNEYMERLNPAYQFPEKFGTLAEEFFKAYTLERELGCPESKMTGLIPPKDRTCRFCKRKFPEVTFRKVAHTYSELLGNHFLINDFECDSCNEKFAVYEDDLAKYLGIDRTMLAMRGKEKIPKYKSPGKKLIMEGTKNDADPDHAIISAKRSEVMDQTFSFDREKKTTTAHFTKHSYIPLHVYKALLKMGLSVIDPKHVSLYDHAFEYLQNDKHDKDWRGFAVVYRYAMPYSFSYLRPNGMIFRKRDPAAPLYTHVFLLMALNSIYEFILPLYLSDIPMARRPSGLILPWAPPIFGNAYPFDVNTIQSMELDLSSGELLKGEKGAVQFSAPPESYDMLSYAGKPPEPFDETKIAGIEFLREKYSGPRPPDRPATGE